MWKQLPAPYLAPIERWRNTLLFNDWSVKLITQEVKIVSTCTYSLKDIQGQRLGRELMFMIILTAHEGYASPAKAMLALMESVWSVPGYEGLWVSLAKRNHTEQHSVWCHVHLELLF